MAEVNERIEQFRKMAEADPTNELGHYALGRELLAVGDMAGAAASLARTIELNPKISKAYQLLAQALVKLDRTDEAITQLTAGVKMADDRGEVLPRTEMIATLREMGAPVPELKSASAKPVEVGEGQVHCKRCGQVKPKMPRPPFRNAFGQRIFESTCADCWQEAIKLGTKVINELRLPLADPQAQKVWDQHIAEFLNLDDSATK